MERRVRRVEASERAPLVRPAIVLLAIAVAIRLVIAAIVPLVPDETYYWEWSRHLAAGYFDHPPAIAWLVRIGTIAVGATPLGVRLGPILASFVGGVAAIALAHELGGASGAWRMGVFLAVVPFAGIGLVLATPDAPLLASAALLLLAVDRALVGAESEECSEAAVGSRQTVGWWMVAGVAAGIGALSKYTIVLLPVAIGIACLVSPVLRRQLARPGPYIATVLAALVCLPVVWWNSRHGWISIRFQLHHGLGPVVGSALVRELTLMGGQAGLVSPVLFVLAMAAVVVAARRPSEPRRFLLGIVAAFVWIFFASSALRRPVEPNWPALAALPALVLLATWSAGERRVVAERIGVALGGVTVVTAYTIALLPLPFLPARLNPVARAYGWSDLARAVSADLTRDVTGGAGSTPPGRVWLAADRYQDASELAFTMPDHPQVFALNLAGRPNQYDLWPGVRDSLRTGDDLTLVLDDEPDPPPPVARLAPYFARIERGALVEMHRGDLVVARRRLWHFLGLTVPLAL